MTRVFKSEREREKSQNDVICKAHLPLLALKIEEGVHEPSNVSRCPLEAGKFKETDCPLEPPEGNVVLLLLGF